MVEVPVLIVGGGPVGLTASILLSRHGIRSLLLDRRPGTAIREAGVLGWAPHVVAGSAVGANPQHPED